jgi:[ribosomal protein S5]-alanine N-acetyltransferase
LTGYFRTAAPIVSMAGRSNLARRRRPNRQSDTVAAPSIVSQRLELVPLTPEVIDELLAGRGEEAGALAGIQVPDGWPDEHDHRFLRLRADQTRKDPAWEQWLVRALALREPGRPMVGHAGFHGPPGINGSHAVDAVEVGYTVFEGFRGRGYATEAARALIAWAQAEHGVHRFIASVAPDNVPSLALVRRLGFVQTGSQWDEEDGEELVFELRT